jgi:hypothetical protein
MCRVSQASLALKHSDVVNPNSRGPSSRQSQGPITNSGPKPAPQSVARPLKFWRGRILVGRDSIEPRPKASLHQHLVGIEPGSKLSQALLNAGIRVTRLSRFRAFELWSFLGIWILGFRISRDCTHTSEYDRDQSVSLRSKNFVKQTLRPGSFPGIPPLWCRRLPLSDTKYVGTRIEHKKPVRDKYISIVFSDIYLICDSSSRKIKDGAG